MIAAEAERESPLWAGALRRGAEPEPVFSALADDRFALGIETIYEGYLLHYGRSRLFAPADADVKLLLGDYLYAHGLVRVSALGDVAAVADLAELISLCAYLRAERRGGDGVAWAATAAFLGRGVLEDGRAALRASGNTTALLELTRPTVPAAALERALATHGARVG